MSMQEQERRTEARAWRGELAAWVVTGVTAGAVAWLAGGPRAGLILGGTILGLAAVVHVGRRRSDALRVVGGVGDERVRTLYTRATAAAGTVLWVVLPVWWAVTVVRGEPDGTLLTLWGVWGLSFLGAALYLSRTA